LPPIEPVLAANRLLAALPRKDCERLLAACEPVDLMFGEILAEPGDPIGHVVFPTESVIALTTPVDGVTHLEVGLVGDEGMLGLSLALGVDIWPLQALVQVNLHEAGRLAHSSSVPSGHGIGNHFPDCRC
jgi:hypothetical protein